MLSKGEPAERPVGAEDRFHLAGVEAFFRAVDSGVPLDDPDDLCVPVALEVLGRPVADLA